MADAVSAEIAAVLHGQEQLAQHRGEISGVAAGLLQQAREQPLGQQPDILGEQAEQQADQEVRHLLRALHHTCAGCRPGGRTGRAASSVTPADRLARFQLLGVEEHRPQDLERFGFQQVIQSEFVIVRVGRLVKLVRMMMRLISETTSTGGFWSESR